MNKEKLTSTLEIFICQLCQKQSASGELLGGGKEMTDELKKWVKENHGGKVKIFRSGCLGQCDNGVTALTYPQREFILNSQKSEIQELIINSLKPADS